MKRIILIAILTIGLSIMSLAVVQARSMTSATYDLSWNIIASGGGTSGNSTYTLIGTIGQSAAGTTGSSSFTLGSGFWSGSLAAYRVVLPVIAKNN